MSILTVQLQGVDAISLRTKALIAAARLGAQEGVSEGAQIIVDEAKQLVPVDTGHLRDSIHQELVESTAEQITVAVTPVYEEPNEYGIEPPYARRIEYGFVGADRLGRIYNQPAQPYMRPAFDTKQEEAREAIKNGIHARLDEAIGGRR
jgi:HK97 gp10 family phage protein